MNNPKFQIFTGKDGQYYFHLRARNGEIILGSEGYVAKSSCQNGIQSVKENAANEARYRRQTTRNGQFYFDLIAANGQVIGVSEMYKTQRGRDHGIEVVKEIAPTVSIEDTT